MAGVNDKYMTFSGCFPSNIVSNNHRGIFSHISLFRLSLCSFLFQVSDLKKAKIVENRRFRQKKKNSKIGESPRIGGDLRRGDGLPL